MLLDIKKRESAKKRDPKRLRRDGFIPAVIYAHGKESSTPVTIEGNAFKSYLRKIPQGSLSTTIFTLKGEHGKETKAIVKDIQYHVVSYDILHLDFEALVKGQTITLNVPVYLTGVVDCVGVKLGGALRQDLRYIRVKCPADEIPASFTIDVKDLAQGQSVKVSDLKVSKNVHIQTPQGEVVVMVTQK
jgi:large subunit ribosomal protein L25